MEIFVRNKENSTIKKYPILTFMNSYTIVDNPELGYNSIRLNNRQIVDMTTNTSTKEGVEKFTIY